MVPSNFHFWIIVTVTVEPFPLEYVIAPLGKGTFALFFTISRLPVQIAGAGVDATGADVGENGAGVGVIGAAVGETGARVGVTGAGVGVTGAGVGLTGARVGVIGAGVGVTCATGAGVGVTGAGETLEVVVPLQSTGKPQGGSNGKL